MSHFSEQAWADFVRGVSPTDQGREIESHLAGGCSACDAASGLWRKVSSIAANEPSLAPPDGIVRIAKLQFSSRQAPQPSPFALARLVFDSVRQPLTAGVRAGASE